MVISKIRRGKEANIILSKEDVMKYFNDNPNERELRGFLVNTGSTSAISVGVKFPIKYRMDWTDASMGTGDRSK